MTERIYQQFLKSRKVSTDTRKIEPDSIFFALKGERFNGNLFALQALEQGAALAVVDEPIDSQDDRLVMVDNVLSALQELALTYRRSLKIPFLAITGSNGKTTTKELIRDVLAKKFRVSATLGNLNNHIGVPLTLLAIPADCEFAVVEMGANHQGEIKSYCEFAEPDFALITNMGKAHLEGFGGVEGVKRGKKELYDYVASKGGVLFVNTELENLKETSQAYSRYEYGFHTGPFTLDLLSENPIVSYKWTMKGHEGEVQTHLAGGYNLYNIASAFVIGNYFGVDADQIHDAIASYIPDNNRSQLTKTERNVLIMDAYNANPTSLENALISLSKQKDADSFFVMGDMRELGEESEAEHRRILQVAMKLNLKGVTVGEWFYKLRDQAPYQSFETTAAAKQWLADQAFKDKLILVKGSRGIRLEEVLSVL